MRSMHGCYPGGLRLFVWQNSRNVTTRLAALVLGMTLAALPSAAQDLLFSGTREVGAFGRFGESLGPAPDWLGSPTFGGDRFVHRLGRGILDRRTGAMLPVAEGFPLAYDRARPHVFVQRNDGVWLVDVTTSWSLLILPGSTLGLTGCVHATSADVLFCAFSRPDGQHDIVHAGPFGPRLVATTRFADRYPLNWLVTPDASRIFLAHCARAANTPGPPAFCLDRGVAAVDVATGVTWSAATSDVLSPLGPLVWDEVTDRLFAVGTRVDVFSRDLTPLGSATTGGRGRQVAVSPHSGRIYLDVRDSYFSSSWATLSAYDAATLRPLQDGVTRTAGAGGRLSLLTAPGAPRDVRATVSGRTVTVSWTNIGGASGFVLEAGLASGRTDLVLHLGPSPHASFVDVPQGTYFLRLRGGNEQGGGRPSPDLVVVVR